MNNFVRITTLLLTALFGGYVSLAYIGNEIVSIANRKDMEGYFNPIGMVWVILSLLIIFTVIPSVICQIKLMLFNKIIGSTDVIDEGYSDRNHQALKKIPSRFLRNANLVFSFTIVFNFLFGLIQVILTEEERSFVFVFIVAFLLLFVLCGTLLSVDALRFKKKVKEFIELYSTHKTEVNS